MMVEWYDQLQRDLRLAGRRATRQATFTVVVLVCIALGVGAIAAALSALHPVVLRAQPFAAPDRLVQVAAFNVNRASEDERYFVSWFPIDALDRTRTVFEGVAAFYQRDFDVLDGVEPERIAGAETLPGSFDVLGVQPLLGRTLTREDVRLGRRVALISESLWTRRYGRDPGVLGDGLLLGEQPHTIVGVVPGPLRLTTTPEVFPVHHPDDYSRSEQLGLGVFLAVARLPEGVRPSDGDRDLEAMRRALLEAEPVFYRDFGFDAMGLAEFLVGDLERPLWAFLAAAGIVLLLATANVVNLLMVRAQGERWEQGLRTALGARCRRLAQQGFVENAVLAAVGAVLGVTAAAFAVRALVRTADIATPALQDAGPSLPVILASVGLAGALAGLMSVLVAARCHSAVALVRGTREGTTSRRERRSQAAFVTGQIALSFVLLVGAGLTWRSSARLAALDLGFDAESLVVARVSSPQSLAGTRADRARFTSEVMGRFGSLPGVLHVGATSWVPFRDGDVGFNYSVEDHPPEVAGERSLAPGRLVAPGYFASMGIPLLSGRVFTESDADDTPLVAVVSRAFEERYWPDGSALGRRIKRGAYNLDRPWIEIVGVVGDIRSGTLSDSIRPAVFYPQAQSDGAFLSQMAYTLRVDAGTSLNASDLRRGVAEVSAAATLYEVSTGADVRRAALGAARFNTLVIGIFAVVGLALAAAGVFGVASYGVGRRRREFGLRIALGARPTQVRRLVVLQGLAVATVGIAIGIPVAAGVTRGLSDLLFEIDVGDVSTYVCVALVLMTSVLLASYGPARRATATDPTSALRDE